MTFRHIAATAFLALATAAAASAQDRITLRDGGTIKAKVKEVSTKTVTYKKWDNQDGPDFVISKNKVQTIKYANGTEDEIDDADRDDNDRDRRDDRYDRRSRRDRDDRYDGDDREERSHSFGLSKEKYGKNILSVAPIQMANESATGFGLQYERVLDKKNIVSVVLPFAMVFNRENDPYNNSRITRAFKYFYPGVKIYPTGSNRRVSYAVGVAAALGFGTRNVDDYNNGYNYYHEEDVFKAGILVNNSLNVQPTKHLYMGVELGLGFTYYTDEGSSNGYYYSNSIDDEPMVQFSFKIGYRF